MAGEIDFQRPVLDDLQTDESRLLKAKYIKRVSKPGGGYKYYYPKDVGKRPVSKKEGVKIEKKDTTKEKKTGKLSKEQKAAIQEELDEAHFAPERTISFGNILYKFNNRIRILRWILFRKVSRILMTKYRLSSIMENCTFRFFICGIYKGVIGA